MHQMAFIAITEEELRSSFLCLIGMHFEFTDKLALDLL